MMLSKALRMAMLAGLLVPLAIEPMRAQAEQMPKAGAARKPKGFQFTTNDERKRSWEDQSKAAHLKLAVGSAAFYVGAIASYSYYPRWWVAGLCAAAGLVGLAKIHERDVHEKLRYRAFKFACKGEKYNEPNDDNFDKKELIEALKNDNQQGYYAACGRFPLMDAARAGAPKLYHELVDAGIEQTHEEHGLLIKKVNEKEDFERRRPNLVPASKVVFECARKKCLERLDWTSKNVGVDGDILDAIWEDKPLLLEGLDQSYLDRIESNGKSVLMLAAERGAINVFHALVKAGLKPTKEEYAQLGRASVADDSAVVFNPQTWRLE